MWRQFEQDHDNSLGSLLNSDYEASEGSNYSGFESQMDFESDNESVCAQDDEIMNETLHTTCSSIGKGNYGERTKCTIYSESDKKLACDISHL